MLKRFRTGTAVLALTLVSVTPILGQQLRPPAPRQRPLPAPSRPLPQLEVDLGQPAPLTSRKVRSAQTPAPVVPPVEEQPVATGEDDGAVELKPVAGEKLPVPPAPELVMAPVSWRQDFESLQRRPIETAVFGKGPHRIAVISNLAGNSDSAVAVVEKLAGLFARQELMPVNLSVLVVRNPNPDGTAGRTLTNSRGVDLNRNFPTTRFTANPSRGTGDHPGSEAETRAMMQLLNQFNPERVILVVESRSTRGTVRSDDILPHELLPNFDAAPFDGVYKSGSLSGYVHQTLKRSIVELELPQEPTPALDEESLVQLAVTVLDQTARNVKNRFAPQNDVAKNSPFTKNTSQPHSDGVRGNVEFLPPPPGSGPMPAAGERFIELPPPPGM